MTGFYFSLNSVKIERLLSRKLRLLIYSADKRGRNTDNNLNNSSRAGLPISHVRIVKILLSGSKTNLTWSLLCQVMSGPGPLLTQEAVLQAKTSRWRRDTSPDHRLLGQLINIYSQYNFRKGKTWLQSEKGGARDGVASRNYKELPSVVSWQCLHCLLHINLYALLTQVNYKKLTTKHFNSKNCKVKLWLKLFLPEFFPAELGLI